MPPQAQQGRNRSRGWCFTLNNYTSAETLALLDQLHNTEANYVFQEETGDNGTPHLQGFAHFKVQIAFSTLRQWNPRIHWERTQSVAASIAYCSDPAKRSGRCYTSGYTVDTRDLRLIFEDDMYDWQKELLLELRGVPDMRTIVWYCDAIGGCGKTAFARWLIQNQANTMFISTGAAKDICYQVIKAQIPPETVVFNLPRSAEAGMSYSALESIKDGICFSGKYEGGCKIFPPPHVVVFANFIPDLSKLSMDRWKIRELLTNPPRVRTPGT